MSISLVTGSNGSAGGPASTSASASFGYTPTDGDLLVIGINTRGNATVTTLPDWNLAKWQDGATNDTYVFWRIASSEGVDPVYTFTLSASFKTVTTWAAFRSTTGWPANPLDQTQGSTATSGTATTGTTATLARSDDLAVAVFGGDTNGTFSAYTNSLLEAAQAVSTGGPTSSRNGSAMGYKFLASTAGVVYSATWSTATVWTAAVVTFQPNASSTTVGGSFTADAFIKKNDIAGSFTADANIRRNDIAGSWTADAYIRATFEGSFTADSYVSKTTESNFTGDSNISKLDIAGSVTADSNISKTDIAGTFTADGHISGTVAGSFTADAYIQGNAPSAPVWVSPADTATIGTLPVLVFTIPSGPAGNYFFHLELDKVNTFDGGDYRSLRTNADTTGWEYWNNSAWTPVPSGGVSSTFAGNDARYTVQSALSAGIWYRRVRVGV